MLILSAKAFLKDCYIRNKPGLPFPDNVTILNPIYSFNDSLFQIKIWWIWPDPADNGDPYISLKTLSFML